MTTNAEWGYVPTVPQTGTTMTLQPPSSWATAQTIVTPRGTAPADVAFRADSAYAVETIEVSTECRALYLRRTEKSYNTATVAILIPSKASNIDWGEFAICKGLPGVRATTDLTVLGYCDAKSALIAGGSQTLSISFSACAAGEHLWLAWSQKTGQGTLAAFSPGVADALSSGLFQYKASTQPSTMGAGEKFAICAYTLEPLWAVVGLGNA
jgi:hypothetical protein